MATDPSAWAGDAVLGGRAAPERDQQPVEPEWDKSSVSDHWAFVVSFTKVWMSVCAYAFVYMCLPLPMCA